MNSQEVKTQMARVERWKELCAIRDKYNGLLRLITREDPDGPCGQGPFTGNTRESRRVEAITVEFTATRGGSPRYPNMRLEGLDLEAFAFGSYLQSHLNKKIKEINDAIEAL